MLSMARPRARSIRGHDRLPDSGGQTGSGSTRYSPMSSRPCIRNSGTLCRRKRSHDMTMRSKLPFRLGESSETLTRIWRLYWCFARATRRVSLPARCLRSMAGWFRFASEGGPIKGMPSSAWGRSNDVLVLAGLVPFMGAGPSAAHCPSIDPLSRQHCDALSCELDVVATDVNRSFQRQPCAIRARAECPKGRFGKMNAAFCQSRAIIWHEPYSNGY